MPSRLSRHQKKQTVYILIGIAIFILAFVSFGIPFLAQGSVFITSLFRGKSLQEAQDEVLGNVEITEIPSATSSATIKIKGFAENFDKVRFVLNSDEVDESDLSEDGEFEKEITGLKTGDNQIYVIAINSKTNKKKSSEEYMVVYIKDKPKLEVKEPQDDSKTSRDEIIVSGQTDTNSSPFINGLPVVVDSSGNFSTAVRLKEGENKIIIKATNDAGISEEKTITVTYEKD